MRFRTVIGIGVVMLMASAASAHDFFLLPADFTPTEAGDLAVQATIGSSFPNPEIVVAADKVMLLEAFSAKGKVAFAPVGPEAKSLMLRLGTSTPGLVVAAISLSPRDVDYGEDRIDVILGEYDVGAAAARLVKELPRPRTLQVSSRRFAKSFVCVAACQDHSVSARPVGLELEFVGGDDANTFKLLKEGRPLGSHTVAIVGDDGTRTAASTDAEGIVRLSAAVRGSLMLFAAAMEAPAISNGRFLLRLTSLTLER